MATLTIKDKLNVLDALSVMTVVQLIEALEKEAPETLFAETKVFKSKASPNNNSRVLGNLFAETAERLMHIAYFAAEMQPERNWELANLFHSLVSQMQVVRDFYPPEDGFMSTIVKPSSLQEAIQGAIKFHIDKALFEWAEALECLGKGIDGSEQDMSGAMSFFQDRLKEVPKENPPELAAAIPSRAVVRNQNLVAR